MSRWPNLKSAGASQVIAADCKFTPKLASYTVRGEESVHSHTPVLLRFLITLPSTTARGEVEERGRIAP
jgi:hypothetical protein